MGRGFDPRGKGDPIEPEERGVRGLGIFIMRALMDSVTYSSTERGTKVVLTKRRPVRSLGEATGRNQRESTTVENRRTNLSAGIPATCA